MAAPIDPIREIALSTPVNPGARAGRPGDFQRALSDAIGQVEGVRAEAVQSVDRYLAGEGEELHNMVLATQRAELSFELFLQTRNKVVQAYQEIMRMQM